MKLCFPVENFQGLNSKISEHFGSAPFFITYDTDSKEAGLLYAQDLAGDDSCNPAAELAKLGIDIVITSGIGPGALNRLLDAGLYVFQALSGVVSEDLERYQNNALPALGYGSGKCDCGS
jgi:predicted Fe-Mo cluster-binding NifX family protein